MYRRYRASAVAAALAFAASAPVLAADYNELIRGDLSGDPANPTVIDVDAGANVVSGSASAFPLDRDIFTLVVPAGLEITEIRLTAFELLTEPSDGGMLVALEQGTQISDLNSAASLRGFAIVGVAPGTQPGDDLLDDLGGGVLGPGPWTVWIQNTGSLTDYALTIQAAAVAPPPPPRSTQPVPALGPIGMLLFLAGMVLAGVRALRRRPG